MSAVETDRTLKLERRFDTSAERVFDAWTDPDIAGQWLFTTAGSETHHTSLDVRVGGQWEITDHRDGVDYRAIGEYRVVDRPHRLVFTFGMPQFSPEFTEVTVEIAADGHEAVMTLTQSGLPAEHIPATEQGWRAMLEELAICLGEGDPAERLVID